MYSLCIFDVQFYHHRMTNLLLQNVTIAAICSIVEYSPYTFDAYLFMFRVGKQRLREARIQGVDFLILCLAGVCLGTLAKVSDETFGALGYTYTVIAVCKLETA